MNVPCLVVSTIDEEEPTAEWAYAPEGYSGRTLTGNEYVRGRMAFFVNDSVWYDSGEYLAGASGVRIKLRGNTSALWNKKSYKIKLSKKNDLFFRDDKKYKSKDWILLNCPKIDLNTIVGFKISELLGMEWTPKSQFVNLIVNGDYKGLYVLVEAIDKDAGRINISNNGFILEDDPYWWNEDYYFKGGLLPDYQGYTLKYPEFEDVGEVTLNKIKDYILEVETCLSNKGDISKYIDVESFAKWLLVHDILGTEDGRGSNRYFYKESLDAASSSLLKIGPPWDFDDILKRKNNWSQQHSGNYRFYYKYLLDNDSFNDEFVNQWNRVKETLYDDLTSFFDDLCSVYGEDLEKSRRFDSERYNRNNLNSLETEIELVESWIREQILWIDEQLSNYIVIDNVYEKDSLDAVFLLDGRKVDSSIELPPGLYIINGKKVFLGRKKVLLLN